MDDASLRQPAYWYTLSDVSTVIFPSGSCAHLPQLETDLTASVALAAYYAWTFPETASEGPLRAP